MHSEYGLGATYLGGGLGAILFTNDNFVLFWGNLSEEGRSTEVIMPKGAPAAWRNVITGEMLAAGQELSVGDILLRFPVALLMGEGKEEYLQTT